MGTEELETSDPFHYCPVDENGALLFLSSMIISFDLLTLREKLFSWHHTARSLTSSL